MAYNSKDEMINRMNELQKEISMLEGNASRTPEEEAKYKELSAEFGSLDTTLKAMDGQADI